MTTSTPERTAAVVALKAGEHAKSRLGSLPAPLRRELAAGMALDTLRALESAVDHVLVVGTLPYEENGTLPPLPGIEQLPEPETSGLNVALAHGAAVMRQRGFAMVLACVGDLPTLRAESVRHVLNASRGHRRSFLADANGVGTTMLVARGTDLRPLFGSSSATAHQESGAHPLRAPELRPVPDARTDVDTEDDLGRAARLGLGPATRAVLDRWAPWLSAG